jgi:N-acetylglucosaminyl-diphospho-decaprenol L-rhamnosyltransferase
MRQDDISGRNDEAVTDELQGVSAVVVAYNSGPVLSDCLLSLDKAAVAEIVLVDNDSDDDSVALAADAVRRVVVVRTDRNLGFGGGVNRGVAATRHDLVLVCNSDLSLDRNAIERLCSKLASDPRAALVGPQLIDSYGHPRVSARTFPSITRSWRQAFAGTLAPRGRSARGYAADNQAVADLGGEVDWVTGACFLVRRTAFREVGGFDTSYFMYVEEVDLCWRLRKSGWIILHEPAARVTHIGGVSTSRRPYAMAIAHHRSLWRFAQATADGAERRALPLVAVAIWFRAALVMLRAALSHRRLNRPPASGERLGPRSP